MKNISSKRSSKQLILINYLYNWWESEDGVWGLSNNNDILNMPPEDRELSYSVYHKDQLKKTFSGKTMAGNKIDALNYLKTLAKVNQVVLRHGEKPRPRL